MTMEPLLSLIRVKMQASRGGQDETGATEGVIRMNQEPQQQPQRPKGSDTQWQLLSDSPAPGWQKYCEKIAPGTYRIG